MLVLPALALAAVCYFGTWAVWGGRGLLALEGARAELALNQQALAALQSENARMRHRIALLRGEADSDLVEELARTVLLDGAPRQVAIPRSVRR
ncbi:MAG TPA: septum formation initiator family protein [Rhizomicrobium sp.]|nr:septum formation initiator family protein [Rhizomicrobium sp.]